MVCRDVACIACHSMINCRKVLDKLEFDEQLENMYFMQKSKKGVRKNERELVVEN